MQTDELRAELAELAREVDPFTEDLPAIRRRVARRRVAGASVAAVLIVGLTAGAIATTRSSGDHVNVTGRPKAVAVAKLARVDALVVLPVRATTADIARVKDILDSTNVVESYATLPSAFVSLWSGGSPQTSPNLRSFSRTYGHSVILGVELDRTATDGVRQLTVAVGSAATVKNFADLSRRSAFDDVEIFMRVNACVAEIDAVRIAVERDPDVESFRFFSKEDALKEFKRLFKDQPSLIENTTASSLPTSFRLRVRDGVLPWAIANRYEHLAGVKGTIVRANPFAGGTSSTPRNEDRSACTRTP
ncbi:MAG: cell division transport system permease protein [Actinomycetota bacterium]|nr:cell division transport system permease protein [Actinomycetota bacterium]